eukprot:452603-Amorphochlora_amoeboformis.AAC.1
MSEDVKSDLSENERGILSPDAEGGTAAYLSLHTRRPWRNEVLMLTFQTGNGLERGGEQIFMSEG